MFKTRIFFDLFAQRPTNFNIKIIFSTSLKKYIFAEQLFRPRVDGRIVGGKDVEIEDYPHQVRKFFFLLSIIIYYWLMIFAMTI